MDLASAALPERCLTQGWRARALPTPRDSVVFGDSVQIGSRGLGLKALLPLFSLLESWRRTAPLQAVPEPQTSTQEMCPEGLVLVVLLGILGNTKLRESLPLTWSQMASSHVSCFLESQFPEHMLSAASQQSQPMLIN